MKRNLKPSSISNGSRKRIKVRDFDCNRPLTCRRDASPISLEERHVTYPNNAKTSEFAYFKKFKEDANLRFSSSLPHQKELQSKKFKEDANLRFSSSLPHQKELQSKKFNSSDHFRERTSPVENRCKDFMSHHLVENVTPVNFKLMHLPLGNSSKISEVDVKHTHKTLEDIQSKQRNVENDDIFSRKRQKLRQFVQNMSFRGGTGESYEKGYGVISTLLSRLIPESNEYKFNNNLEKLQRLPGRCFPRLGYEHHLKNNSSPHRFYKSRGRVFSHSDLSTNSNDNNFHVKYRTKESDYEPEGKMSFLDVNGSPLTAAVENCRSLISSCFKPQYVLYDRGEPLPLRKQELEPLLLGWDTDNIKDEGSSSQLTELNTFSEPPILFADDHQLNLHNSFGAVALCSSPFPFSNNRNSYSLPYSSLASYQIHGLSRHNVENEEDIDATFNNEHLNFSSVPKRLSQYDNYVDDRGSHDFFSAQSANWLMNNVWEDECQRPSVESMCASGLVFDFGWKYFSGLKERCQTTYQLLKYPLDEMRLTSPVNEECNDGSSDGVLVEYRSPFFIQPESFFQEGKVCSLLTDKLSWDTTRSEINVDITEMDYV